MKSEKRSHSLRGGSKTLLSGQSGECRNQFISIKWHLRFFIASAAAGLISAGRNNNGSTRGFAQQSEYGEKVSGGGRGNGEV